MASYDKPMGMGFCNPLELIRFGPEDAAQARDTQFDQEHEAFHVEE